MTKYNFQDHEDNELHTSAITYAIFSLSEKQFLKASQQPEITLTVNGEEIDFLKFADRFFAHIDHLAKEKARAIVEEWRSSASLLMR